MKQNTELTFLGRGSAFNSAFGNTSAYIKDGDNLFLIDCGSLVFSKLKELNILENVSNVHVLLTHTHDDHIGSLGALILYGYYSMGEMFKPSVTISYPHTLKVGKYLEIVGVSKDKYKEEELTDYDPIYAGDIEIYVSPEEVNHVGELYCYGYEMTIAKEESNGDIADSQIYYSGDSNEIPHDILLAINNGLYDEVYIDTCKADFDGNVHLSLRKLDELINKGSLVRNKVYCMHLDTDFTKEANDLGFNVVEIG